MPAAVNNPDFRSRENIFSWPIFRPGVRLKVMFILLSILLTALSISAWLAIKEAEDSIHQEIQQRGTDISRFVAKSLAYSVVGYDYHTIQLLVDEITRSDDIGYASVFSRKGNLMAEAGSDIEAGLVMFAQDIRLHNESVGQLRLGFSATGTLQRLDDHRLALILREGFIILLIACCEFAALSYIIIRPVRMMSRALESNSGQSDYAACRLPVVSDDEFGQLATRFNLLCTDLSQANQQLLEKARLADKKLAETNNQLVARSVELKKLDEEFRKLSITDPLTGVYNRQQFEQLMRNEILMSHRHHDINSLLVIDIDHFRFINDKYGYSCGDQVLVNVSRILLENLRSTDFLCRIGREEFAIFCKRADRFTSMQIAEKLRELVQSRAAYCDGEDISVTISAGVVTIPADNEMLDRPDIIYQRADEAVYESKRRGRNCVTHYEDLHT